ncbi:DUF3426 domain-containing protein [Rhodoferax aquaticus]|uniref:DUF3426 domain-containing protein n=1 Tax=Rhodoferax aquaticus TaxID=2527691 RepID=UPI001F457BD5|nr:DUF3426 domain-containing protein [Rhodoferax aquaticus]
MPTDLSRGPADEVRAPGFPSIALPKFELNTGDASDAQPERATFMRSQSEPSTKRSLAIRTVSSLVALAFFALLLGQVSVHDRDRLAAKAPAFKPLLQAICELAACQLGLPREIESVVIDSSSFVKIKAEVYKLNVTLKNTASTELAMPSLELTLTDSQDQTIVRRVIAATEIDVLKNSALATGSDLSVSVPVSVKLPSNSERVSGYRLLAFYP